MTARRGVRLAAGALKGRSLVVPAGVRPTESRVREALFDILGPRLGGASFLDLFAGSGAVGLEALSRGAARLVQVDADPGVVRRLAAAYETFGVDGASCVRLELPRRLERLAPTRFDWVFADPPYDFADHEGLLAALPAVLAPDGVAILEHPRQVEPEDPSGALAAYDHRRYGGSVLSFYALSGAG